MQGLYKGLGLQSNLEKKILTTNTDIKQFTQVYESIILIFILARLLTHSDCIVKGNKFYRTTKKA